MTRRPTRDDMSREAGASSAVVNYVINYGPRPVSEQTRQRVLEATGEPAMCLTISPRYWPTGQRYLRSAGDRPG